MPRKHRLASALALALAGASAAQAQEFTNVVSFGDSLSDAGNVAAIDGNPYTPPGSSFTTNPDSVAVQLVAEAFGFNQTSISALYPSTGSNYAYGGACVRADSIAFNCVNSPDGLPFSIADQLNFYLASNGGKADGNALYTVWGGANDIFTYASLVSGGYINAAQAQQLTGLSALTEVNLIKALQGAGANYVVVFNLPDIGVTPLAAALGAQASFSGLSFVYNDTLNTGIGTLGDGIIPINVNALVNEVIADPSAYGFSNITAPACGTYSGSLACGPAGDPNYFYHYAPGTNETFFFADGIHPTGAAHRLLANVVVATIQAPGQVSLAGEVPLQVYEEHSGAINGQIFATQGTGRETGDTSVWGSVQYGDQKYDASANTAQMDSKLVTLSFGADYRFSDNGAFGGAISFGGSNGDYGAGHGSGIDGREVLASLYGVYNIGNLYLDAIASAGSNSLDIDRAIVLGPTTRIDTGNTDAKHMAFEVGAGYLFGSEGGLRHGPFASVAWQKVEVDGYAEETSDSTSMYFNDFTRESLVGRIGWQLKGDSGAFHPYARIAYAEETKDDVTRVQAGSTSLNGHFTMNGFIPAQDWVEADLGLAYDLNDHTQLTFAYRGHLNDDTQSRNSVNVGFRMSFGNAAPAVVPEPAPAEQTCADLDDDGDGVNNCDDKCPASEAGQAVGPDGCPVPLTIDLKGVNFDFDKATLRPESIAILDEAIAILTKYPELKVEVAGHTDSIGSEQYNQGLSERRAKAVYDYLTGHGVDAARLSGPTGYGESRPIAPNTNEDGSDNPEGRAQNRRTELDVQN